MTVTKILEQTLPVGSTSVSFTDADIPNSLIRVFSSNPDIIPVSRTLINTTLTVTYEAQPAALDVAVEIVKQGLDIVDNLTSMDADKALSAKQGNLLNIAIEDNADNIQTLSDNLDTLTGRVDNLDIPDNITDLDDVNVTSIQDGQVLAWDDTAKKFVNVDQSGGGSYPYIDLSNQIYTSGVITSNFSSFSYIANQDCWIRITTHGTGTGTSIVYLNSVLLCGAVSSSDVTYTPFLIKAGDVITLRDLSGCSYLITVYGTR